MNASYYKPSGKISPAGLGLGLAGGLINGLLLAFVYAYVIAYLPFVYLNFLATIGYGLLLGFITGSLMRLGKVRNRLAGAGVALVVALVSLYFAWAVWMSVILGKAGIDAGALEIAQQPSVLWELVTRVSEVGVWSIRRVTVSGVVLWLIWIAEALIVLGGSVIAAVGVLSNTPFCEACQSWCSQTKELMLAGDADPAELKRRMEAKDFDYVRGLGPKKEGQQDWARFDLYECTGCGQTNTLSVAREHLTVDKKGNSGKRSTEVVDHLLVDKADVYRLRQVGQELGRAVNPAPVPPAAPAAPPR